MKNRIINIIQIAFLTDFNCLLLLCLLRKSEAGISDNPNTTSQNDSYAMTYANKSLAFINSNYDLVPTTCLVFSPSPYIWYQLNRIVRVRQKWDRVINKRHYEE